ncbi:MAG: hypothetical protein AAGF12_21855 [Myxococcota bacterium]
MTRVVAMKASIGCTLWLLAAVASGQPPDDATELARAHFEAAQLEADQGNFETAAELFRRSLAALPQAVTAYNLALMLQRAGRPTEAIETTEAILGGDFGPISDDGRQDVHSLRMEAEAALATLVVTIDGASHATAELGDERATIARHERLERRIDPGDHTVRAHAGERSITQQIRLDPGEHRRLVLQLPPEPVAPSAESSSPVLPIILGVVGAAVVASVVVAVVLLASPDDDGIDVFTDPVTGIAYTLSFR